ncbi:MAG: hypothetical protein R3E12_11635 [Candidatus Eisenbacteria bacterium]
MLLRVLFSEVATTTCQRHPARVSPARERAWHTTGWMLGASPAVAMGLLLTSAGQATPQSVGARYEATLEWTGPYFTPAHASGIRLETDTPVTEFPFRQPIAVVAREHDSRDVIYVLDAGHHRIQVFESNATLRSLSQDDLVYNVAPGAAEYNDQYIHTPEYAVAAVNWIVPRSEAIFIDGIAWTRVDDLTGLTSDDQVYTVDYGARPMSPSSSSRRDR